MAGIGRNLEKDEIYINKFMTGLCTMRSPLFTPLSAMGLSVIKSWDTLYGGLNADISHKNTLIRRPGFTRYCSTVLGGSEYPVTFSSFKNTSGVVKAMVDTNARVAWFDSTSVNTVFTKTTTNQVSFQKVGSTLYMCDGVDADTMQWDGTTTRSWGIVAPATAPTLSFLTGSLTVKAGYRYVYVYKDSTNGHISTASPVSANTLTQTAKNIVISGEGSTNSRVDQIEIYRTDDGGANFYYLATVANSTTWSYTDTSTDDQLNDDRVAPTANINDPPPSGISLIAFYLGRMWVAVKNKLYFGGGPDVTNGVPEECFPPANVFVLPGNITAMAPTSNGLAVWTHDDAFVILGSDIASFFPKRWQANFGIPNQNCVVQDGDQLFILTSKAQLFSISTSNLSETGYPIQGNIGAFNPATSYLALHRSGTDEGLFVCNGSTDVYRYSVSMQCWSTVMQPVNGVKCLESIEVAPGDYRLLLGRATGAGYILARDPNSNNDEGSTYDSYAIVGSLMLAPPRQTVLVNSVLIEAEPIGTYPTVSVLLNEVSGTFTELPNPVNDPPLLLDSQSVWMKRHDLKKASVPLPQNIRHMQIKVQWASENAANELIGLGIA